MFQNIYDDLFYNIKTSLLMRGNLDNTNKNILLYPLLLSIFYYFFNVVKNFLTKKDFYKFILETIENYFYKSAVINFQICMIRLNYQTRIEADDGYQAIRHYLFNNILKLKGLSHLKKIPKLGGRNDDDIDNDNDRDFFDDVLKDLYLDNNKMILPNKLQLSSRLWKRKNPDNKEDCQGGEKYYFDLELKCDIYDSSDDNLRYLLEEYKNIVTSYQEYTQSKTDDCQYCYYYDSHQDKVPYFNELCIGKEYKSFDSIFFPGKEKFLDNMDFFINNKTFYQKIGRPYRNIILSHGEPGCGKTSIILGLLTLLRTKYNQKRHLIHLNLDNLSRNDLQNIFFTEYISINNSNEGRVKIPFDKRIYFIEEIDGYEAVKKRSKNDKDFDISNIVNDDKKIQKFIDKSPFKDKDELSSTIATCLEKNKTNTSVKIQDLLELLDGPITFKNSELFVITTNFINKLDEALIRPGRVNHLIELKKCTKTDLKKIIEFYYDTKINIEFLDLFTDYQFTPAFVSECCNQHKTFEECINHLSTLGVQ